MRGAGPVSLAATGGPVRAFFADAFPHTSAVVRETETAPALRDGQQTAPLAAAPGVNPGRAGTAVDYLMRFALAPQPCPQTSAGRLGAGMLGRDLSLAALAAVEEALVFVAASAPAQRTVSDAKWEEITRVSLLLATFEAVYRSGLPPAAFADLVSPPSSWQEWAALVCVDAEVEDVAMLGWAAAQDHAHLRGRRLVCNPTFAQSRALRGADADLITDTGLLIELKSTSTTRTCSGTDLWQLCGYALADTDAQHRITRWASAHYVGGRRPSGSWRISSTSLLDSTSSSPTCAGTLPGSSTAKESAVGVSPRNAALAEPPSHARRDADASVTADLRHGATPLRRVGDQRSASSSPGGRGGSAAGCSRCSAAGRRADHARSRREPGVRAHERPSRAGR
jgi:hypothetical protein